MRENVMRTFVAKEKELQLRRQSPQDVRVDGDQWNAAYEPGPTNIPEVGHLDRPDRLATEIGALEVDTGNRFDRRKRSRPGFRAARLSRRRGELGTVDACRHRERRQRR